MWVWSFWSGGWKAQWGAGVLCETPFADQREPVIERLKVVVCDENPTHDVNSLGGFRVCSAGWFI